MWGEHTCGTCVHVYISAQVHTHNCIHTCLVRTKDTHTHTPYMCTHIHTQMYTHVQVHTHTHTTHVHAWVRVHTHTHLDVYTCAGAHTHTHTHTCTHMCETHDFTAEATGAFPVGQAFYYSAYFPSLQ